MENTELEPGFLQAYRLFVVTRIVFWVIIGPILIVVQMAQGAATTPDTVSSMTLIERLTLPNVAPVIVMEVLLLALLLLVYQLLLEGFVVEHAGLAQAIEKQVPGAPLKLVCGPGWSSCWSMVWRTSVCMN